MTKEDNDTDVQAAALAIAYRQKLDVYDYSKEILATTKEAASQARELLVPILQRWGVGLTGGAHNVWLYPSPMGGGIATGWGDAYLQLMYPELWQLVWGDFNPVNKGYLLTHVGDIPLPDYDLTSDRYLWIAASVEPEDEYGDTIITQVFTVPCKDKGEPLTLYFGPITREFYEDYTACMGVSTLSVPEVGDLLEELPVYVVDPVGQWQVSEEGNWSMDNNTAEQKVAFAELAGVCRATLEATNAATKSEGDTNDD